MEGKKILIIQGIIFSLVLLFTIGFPSCLENIILDPLRTFYLKFSFNMNDAPPYAKHWYIAAILINFLGMVFAFIDLLNRPNKGNGDTCVAVLIGVFGVLSVFTLFLVHSPWPLLASYVSLGVYALYVATDLIGLQSGDDKNKKIYKYSLNFLDVPSVFLTILFIWYGWKNNLTIEFSTGVAAGILVFSNFVFLAIQNVSRKENTLDNCNGPVEMKE